MAHFLWNTKKLAIDGGKPEVLPGEAMALVVEGTGSTRECDFYSIEVNWS
jgi:hypothetical protein